MRLRVSLHTLTISAALNVLMAGTSIGADWKDALEQKLRADIVVAYVSGDRLRITKPGTVFVVQKDGVSDDRAADLTPHCRIKRRAGSSSRVSGCLFGR